MKDRASLNLVSQALLVLLKKSPPKGRKLLIIATSSRKHVMEDLELTSAFTDILHVPNLTQPEHLLDVCEATGVFTNLNSQQLKARVKSRSCNVGIKTVLGLIDMVRVTEEGVRVAKLLGKLEEEMHISMQ